MPTRNVNLAEHFDRFIETVTSGRFSNASGDYTALNSEEELDAFLGEIREEVTAR